MSAFQQLIDAADKFREDRDWRQFHKPKDLALSLTLEAAEDLGIDLEQAVLAKIEENARKYPVEKSKRRSEKYTAYRQV